MNYEYSSEQKTSFQAFAKLCNEQIAPKAKDMDKGEYKHVVDLLRENLKRLADFGYLGLRYPEKWGGTNRPYAEAVIYMEELCHACPSTFLSAGASSGLCGIPILTFGTEEQKGKYLPSLISAKIIGSLGLTEPACGTDLSSIKTKARKKDGKWILNGTKSFITNAPICDIAVVLSKIYEGEAEQGTGLFIVERGMTGFSTSAPMEKMGYHGSPTGELIFEDCALPLSALLGEEGQGFAQAMRTLEFGRIGMASGAVGIARACFDEAVKYSKEREAFGHKICKFQEVSFKIADMKMLIDTGQLLARYAAWLMDINDPEGDVLSRCAKVFATEAATKISSWALQIHGGYGYLSEFPIERLYREAKLGEIGEGTNEIQRVLIARDCLERWG